MQLRDTTAKKYDKKRLEEAKKQLLLNQRKILLLAGA
jgi:hypothetical protein